MIFSGSHYNRRLFIVLSDGTLDTELSLSIVQPFDVTCIDDQTVAVTTFNDNRIQIIDTKAKQVTKTIKTGASRVKDDTIKNDLSYITTSGENIYYTDNDATVKCYSVKGDKRWEYKNESIMSATGIAVDQHGIVYVMSNRNKSVVLISADGKNSRTLLTEKDGIQKSYGIYFHIDKLYVVSISRVLLKFDIA
ncbi:unnamed protein product [Mytilus coruscus]|uniref:Uncharacterized protein n=1 Tax=Mytilus coruscus TaxID=42192 RepID=A0A6J8B9J7_MYTCO|nr:unnamed protein product [Mytilus coruscus]